MLKWLLTLFSGVLAAAPLPPAASYAPPSIPPRPQGKIAIVVGHNPAALGAIRVTDRRTEYDWNGALAERIGALEPDRFVIIRRTAGANEIARAYAEVGRCATSSCALSRIAPLWTRLHGASGTGSSAMPCGVQSRSLSTLP